MKRRTLTAPGAGTVSALLAEALEMPEADVRALAAAGAIYVDGKRCRDAAKRIAAGAQLQAAFGSCDANGQRAILAVLPAVLAKTGSTHASQCREVVASGLKLADPAARVLAIRLAIHPEVRMRPDVVPLLNAAEAEVRRAALVAVATTIEGELIGDEDLFRWLHDPDEGVRKLCRDALVVRENGSYVMRIKADNTAERVEVKAGASDGELTAVTGELSAGDTVVVRGAERLTVGQKVRIAERPAVAAAGTTSARSG